MKINNVWIFGVILLVIAMAINWHAALTIKDPKERNKRFLIGTAIGFTGLGIAITSALIMETKLIKI